MMLTLIDRLFEFSHHNQLSPHEALIKRLEKLLNTREGDCACKTDYGLFDLGDIEYSSNSLWQLAEQINQCITHNEPTLNDISVSPSVDQPQRHFPHFVIKARLNDQAIYCFTELKHNNLTVRY